MINMKYFKNEKPKFTELNLLNTPIQRSRLVKTGIKSKKQNIYIMLTKVILRTRIRGIDFLKHKSYEISAFFAGTFLSIPIMLTINPIFDGWFNFPLGDQTRLPYRDYYLPVPPIVYFEAQFFKLFPYSGLILRIFSIMLYGLLTWALYSITEKYLTKIQSLIVSVFSTSILLSLKLEAPGGWNTQSTIFSILGLSIFISQWNAKISQTSDYKTRKNTLTNILAGVLLFIAAGIKQTIFLPHFMLLIFAYFGSLQKKNKNHKYVIQVIVLTHLILGVALIGFMKSQFMLTNFRNYVLSSGAKNLDPSNLILKLTDNIIVYSKNPSIYLAGLILVFYFVKKKSGEESRLNQIKNYFPALLSVSILTNLQYSQKFLVFVVVLIVLHSSSKILKNKTAAVNRVHLILGMLIPIVYQYITYRLDPKLEISSNFQILKTYILSLNKLTQNWIALCLLIIPFLLFIRIKRRNSTLSDLELVMIYTLANLPLATVSSGGQAYLFWFIPFLAIFLAFMVGKLNLDKNKNIAWSLIVVVIISTLSFVTNTLKTPYEWWGWKEPTRLQTDYQFVKNGYNKGILISGMNDGFYGKIQIAQKVALKESGIPTKTIFTFPNLTYLETLIQKSEYRELTCPSLWFDLCPNYLVKEDLIRFSNNPPSVVVWSDLTEESFYVHEELFLRDRSNLRLWQNFRQVQVRTGAWKEIEVFEPNKLNLNSTRITVYSVQE